MPGRAAAATGGRALTAQGEEAGGRALGVEIVGEVGSRADLEKEGW